MTGTTCSCDTWHQMVQPLEGDIGEPASGQRLYTHSAGIGWNWFGKIGFTGNWSWNLEQDDIQAVVIHDIKRRKLHAWLHLVTEMGLRKKANMGSHLCQNMTVWRNCLPPSFASQLNFHDAAIWDWTAGVCKLAFECHHLYWALCLYSHTYSYNWKHHSERLLFGLFINEARHPKMQ